MCNRQLLQIPELSMDFTRHRLYFDSDYSSQETFTVSEERQGVFLLRYFGGILGSWLCIFYSTKSLCATMEFYRYVLGKDERKIDYSSVYLASSFQPVINSQIFAGNLVNAQTIRREKYPREYFPEVLQSLLSTCLNQIFYF